ncbi:ABHD10 [Symbiodinium sp. CCMP2456]|nr:ABHD10 [Symbiodinium sp. CCMP2456]
MDRAAMPLPRLSLLYLPGCGSLPGGRKERFLEAYAKQRGCHLRCLEYAKPLGSEDPLRPAEALSSLEEAVRDAQRVSLPPALVVAASMGAWIAAGLARLGGVCGALLLAPAGARIVSKAMAGRSAGTAILPSEHSATGGYTINSTILVELEEASIADMMPAACPVCILHGDKDEAVPLEASEELLGQLLAKGGEARSPNCPSPRPAAASKVGSSDSSHLMQPFAESTAVTTACPNLLSCRSSRRSWIG